MENGHADTGPETLSGLADFLADLPDEEPAQENEAESAESPDEETDDAAQDDQTDEEDSENEEPEPTPERKIAIKLKGKDGSETDIEVSEEELIKGYHRQADYTRKAQALAEREAQAVELFKTKHDEIRNHYVNEAQKVQAALVQMAGFKSDQEMAQLADADPEAWVMERQRQENLRQMLGNLDARINAEREKAQEDAKAQEQVMRDRAYKTAWDALQKAGVTKDALVNIYQSSAKAYGFDLSEFANLYDHRLVLALKDAAAYRELKTKAPEVTKKAKDAPRMPSKQSTPANERKAQQLNARFKGGRAKLSDLASLLM